MRGMSSKRVKEDFYVYEAEVEIGKSGETGYTVTMYRLKTNLQSRSLHFWNRRRLMQKWRDSLMRTIMKDEDVVCCSIVNDRFVRDMRIITEVS